MTSMWAVTTKLCILGVVIVKPGVISVNRIQKDNEAFTTSIEILKI